MIWNHKLVHRIYCELELNLRIKPRRRLKREKPEELAVPGARPREFYGRVPLKRGGLPCPSQQK